VILSLGKPIDRSSRAVCSAAAREVKMPATAFIPTSLSEEWALQMANKHGNKQKGDEQAALRLIPSWMNYSPEPLVVSDWLKITFSVQPLRSISVTSWLWSSWMLA
jgi:hypothetical protein